MLRLGRSCPSRVHPSSGWTVNKEHTAASFIGWEMQYDQSSHSFRQLATGSLITAMRPLRCHVRCSFSAKHQITQVTQPLYSPDLVPCDLWLFPKLKSPLKGKRFQTINEIQENMMGQLMEIGRTVWGPTVPTLKGTEVSLSCVQCFFYLVSSSVHVSIFHIIWLDTFWTDLIYPQNLYVEVLTTST